MERIHKFSGSRFLYKKIGKVELMTEGIKRLSNTDIGRRLRVKREAVPLTQADAARQINVARTTLVSIEQGQRRIRIDELQRLAALYETSANAILRDEAAYPDLVPRFRRLDRNTETAVEEAVQVLNGLVSAETELENTLGIKRARRYFPECQILPGGIREQAENNAQELRNMLGIGSGPILDMMSILDQRLGIRVYLRKIDSKISGLFAYEEDVGACMLLNANHPVDRIRQSAAHELGHFYSTRRQAEIFTEDNVPNSREERYANSFARCFLTPAREVKERFASITAGQSHFTRRHVILLACESGVSREAMVRRLEELSLVKKGTWGWFQSNGGITDEQARQVLGHLPEKHVNISLSGSLVPPRLGLLAREVSKRGLYSEGQLAQLLKLSRQEVREVLDGVETEQEEANEIFRLPN